MATHIHLEKFAMPSLLLALTLCSLNLPSYSRDDEAARGYYSAGYKPITNDEFITDDGNATTYLFRAELAIKRRQWPQAVVWLRKSLRENDDDIDTHKALAVCLENQIENQDDKNSPAFKECINEWLIVLRNMKGAEKGLSNKDGTSFTNNQKWEDELGPGMARTHLKRLCGSVPKQHESNKKFVARVTRETEENVSATVLKPGGTHRSIYDQE